MSDAFLKLGPDGALRAVESAGFVPTGHVAPLTCLENRVYDVRLADGRHVVVKFYRPGRWTRQAILEEHRFLAELRQAEVPACAPLALGDGETLRQQDGLHYAIWPRTGGRSPDELADAELAILGRLLARIHNVGAVAEACERPRIDARSRIHEPLAVLEQGFLPPSCARRYRAAATQLAALYDERSRGVPVHRIHGDCHRGNLLYRPPAADPPQALPRAQRAEGERSSEGWFFLDFDDFCSGPAVQDVWMLLPGRDVEAERQRRLLIDAYRQLRAFDERWLALVEPLRGMRFVWYAGWIARRLDDPVFPDAFPHFGSEEYWERETRDLEEQLERLRRGEPAQRDPSSGTAAAAEPASELTNQDFFWDL